MHVFITGASGYVGSLLSKKLIANGHKVSGLTRTKETGEKLTAMGVEPIVGALTDLKIIGEAAKGADAIVHLAFSHDVMMTPDGFDKAVDIDTEVIRAIGDSIKGTGKIFIGTSGFAYPPGKLANEETEPIRIDKGPYRRQFNSDLLLSYSKEGVKTSIVRLATIVHGSNDKKGFMNLLKTFSKTAGFVTQVAGGENHWVAIHESDAIEIYYQAIQKGLSNQVYHGFTEMVKLKDINKKFSDKLNLPIKELTAEEASKTVYLLAFIMTIDMLASSDITQKLLDWTPSGKTLSDDLDNYYLA